MMMGAVLYENDGAMGSDDILLIGSGGTSVSIVQTGALHMHSYAGRSAAVQGYVGIFIKLPLARKSEIWSM